MAMSCKHNEVKEGVNMLDQCNRIYNEHKSYFEKWNEGAPVESWIDENGNTCIRYESGRWWHYRQHGDELIWW